MRDLYESVLRDIGKHGIPELDIPPVDPIHLTNVTVSVLNMANITMVDGVAKGIKDCIFEKFRFVNFFNFFIHLQMSPPHPGWGQKGLSDLYFKSIC